MIRFICFALCLSLLLFVSAQTSTKTKEKVTTLKGDLKEVRSDKKVEVKKLNAVRADMREVKDDLAGVDNRMESIEGSIHKVEDRIEILGAEKERLTTQLGRANQELKEKSAVAEERLRYILMHGSASVVTAFVGAQNISELASRKFVHETVATKDRELFESVQLLRDKIAQNKKRTEQNIDENAALLVKRRQEHATWNELRNEKQTILNKLTDKAEKIEALVKKFNDEEAAIQRKIEEYMSSGVGMAGSRPGKLLLPVNGRFSSGFGMRNHPVLRRARMHTGQDIAAPTGTSIRAAASGTVITASRMGGYGNVIILSHGGGMTTLYGHCSKLLVSSGDKVSRGQVIGRVGSTGLSTGPHLHFEVAINGRKVNPRGYL